MKLFIDSGNIKDIETLAAIGIIDGVTTNHSLLARRGRTCSTRCAALRSCPARSAPKSPPQMPIA
jgi:transaldolase